MVDLTSFMATDLFNYLILPILIFCARIIDVSIGTVRVILMSRGNRAVAPILGFFEVLIWITVVSQILNSKDLSPIAYVAYAAGFATGTYVGMLLEEKLSLGTLTVRIVTQREANELVKDLRDHNFGATSFDGEGRDGRVKLIFTTIKRQDVDKIRELIKKHNPNAFYSISEVKYATETGFAPGDRRNYFSFFKFTRKGK